jgi:hypothetical protein
MSPQSARDDHQGSMASAVRKHRHVALIGVPAVLIAVGVLVPLVAAGGTSPTSSGPAFQISRALPAANAFERVTRTQNYAVRIRVTPNRGSARNLVTVAVTKHGRPITGARTSLDALMLDMKMPARKLGTLHPTANGYGVSTIPLGMGGHWRLKLLVHLPGGQRLPVAVVDRMAP